jgi:hypothetical protein
MESVIGVLACLIASTPALFVCIEQPNSINFSYADLIFPLQAAGLYGVPALFMARTSSVCATCRLKALLSRMVVKRTPLTASFTAASPGAAMVGSCRYVEMAVILPVDLSHPAFRLALVPTSATTIIFAGVEVAIVSPPGVAIRVRLHRNVGKLSWRRRLSTECDWLSSKNVLTNFTNSTTFSSVI